MRAFILDFSKMVSLSLMVDNDNLIMRSRRGFGLYLYMRENGDLLVIE